jgi:hypothetical protein
MELPDSRVLWYYTKYIQPVLASGNKATYHSCCHSINKRGRQNTSDVHKQSISIAHLFKKRKSDEDKIKDLREFLAKLPEERRFFPLTNKATCGYTIEEILDAEVPEKGSVECRFCQARASRENEIRHQTQTIERQTSPVYAALDFKKLDNLFQYIGRSEPLQFDQTFEFNKELTSDLNECSSSLTIERSNEWKIEHLEQYDQPGYENEINQHIIDEWSQELKGKDQTIKEMTETMKNLKEENLSLKKQIDDFKLDQLLIASTDFNDMYLTTNYCKKRQPKVNSKLQLEKKKPEVKSSEDLSKRIDNLLKKSKLSFGGFDLKR